MCSNIGRVPWNFAVSSMYQRVQALVLVHVYKLHADNLQHPVPALQYFSILCMHVGRPFQTEEYGSYMYILKDSLV